MANQKIIERKQQTVEEIVNKAKNASCFVLFENQGLTVSETNELRRELRKSGSDFKIYKNKRFYIKNGKWNSNINTLVKKNGEWLGIVNGKWDTSANTLIKYKGKWFYVKNGKWNKSKAIVRYVPEYVEIKDGIFVKTSELKSYLNKSSFSISNHIINQIIEKKERNDLYL